MRAFISYSHADEKHLERVHKHLAILKREGTLKAWTDSNMQAGDQIDPEIMRELNNSDVFIALISPDYLASTYCYDKEFFSAIELNKADRLRIVPIILERCDWQSTPIANFLALPKDGKPVSEWTNLNIAYADITSGIRKLIEADMTKDRKQAGHQEFENAVPAPAQRRPRIVRDFDSIDKEEFARKSFLEIHEYFKNSCGELNDAGEQNIRTSFRSIDDSCFTCTIVNRGIVGGQESHITVYQPVEKHFLGDINFTYERGVRSHSNGGFNVETDKFSIFLKSTWGARNDRRMTAREAAEELWNELAERAGVVYD